MIGLNCLYEGHAYEQISKICLNSDCLRRKACPICLISFHKDHYMDCVSYDLLETILLNEENKLNLVVTNIQAYFEGNNNIDGQKLIFSIKQKQNLIIECLRDVHNKQLQNQALIFDFAMKSYNSLILQELLNQVICEFTESEAAQTKILKIINNQYNFENIEYLSKILHYKGKLLLFQFNYREALILLDGALQLKITPEILIHKSICLAVMGRSQESIEFEKQAIILGQNEGKNYFQLYTSAIQSGEQEWDILHAITQCACGLYQNCINVLLRIDYNRLPADKYCEVMKLWAYSLSQLKRYSETIEVCDQGLQRLQNNEYLLKLKHECLKQLNRHSEGLLSIEEPDDDHLKLMKGIYLMKENKPNEAMEEISKIKTEDPKYTEYIKFLKGLLIFILGHQLINDKRVEEGLDILKKVQFTDNDVMQKHLKIQTFVAQNNIPEALKILDELLDKDGQSKYLWFMKSSLLIYLGHYLQLLDNFNQAVECIDVALCYHPSDPRLFFAKAYYLAGLFNFPEALQNINKAIELNYITFESLELKGKLLLNLLDYVKSLEIYKQICSSYPNNPAGFFQRGTILLYMKQFQPAILDFQQAVSLDKCQYSALYNIGYSLTRLQKSGEAAEVYKTILFFKKSRIYHIESLFYTQQYDESLKFIQKIVKGQKYYQRSQVIKFKILFLKGQYSEAWEVIKLLNEEKFKNLFTFKIITLIKQQKIKEASDIIEKHLTQQPVIPQALYYKGYLLESQNHFSEALEYYNRSLYLCQSPQVIGAQVSLLKKMQKNKEAQELQKVLEKCSPHFNFSTDLHFDISFDIQYKADFEGMEFKMDLGKISYELQVYK